VPTMNLRSLSTVALVVSTAAGCPPQDSTCDRNTDCAFGQVCVEGVCAVAIGDGGRGPDGGDGDGGRDDAPLIVQVNGPISMFQPGDLGALGVEAGQPAGTALVGIYEPGGRDQVMFFDVARGDLPDLPAPGDGVDFRNAVNFGVDGCNLDHASQERGFRTDGDDEVWFSCNTSGLVQARGADEFQNFMTPVPGAEGADHVVAFGADPIDPQILQRRMFARRGTSNLFIQRAEQGQDAATNRSFDSLGANLTFGEIVGLFKIADMNPERDLGDIVVVFDRASPLANGKPALVPIERPFAGNTTTWVPARLPWAVVQLPDATHAVRLGAIPDPRNLAVGDDNTVVNLTVFLPTEGRVAFGRLERTIIESNGVFDGDDFGFQDLRLERQGTLPTTVPPSSDRILITDIPGVAGGVFYMLTTEPVGWRLLLHATVDDNLTNDVRGAVVNRSGPSTAVGLIPFLTADEAWVAFVGGGSNELHRVTFNQ